MKSMSNSHSGFNAIINLIKTAKDRIIKTVNTEIIDLYWQIGKEVSEKAENGGWGKSVVDELSSHIAAEFGNIRGFSSQNIWRMKQFYETYKNSQILSALLRELSWTNNLLIMSRAKTDEEKLFYIKLAIDEKYSSRELDRQFDAVRYERAAITGKNFKNLPVKQEIKVRFLDNYALDFLNLPEHHLESKLQKAIISNMKKFLLEIGKDRVDFENGRVLITGFLDGVIQFKQERLSLNREVNIVFVLFVCYHGLYYLFIIIKAFYLFFNSAPMLICRGRRGGFYLLRPHTDDRGYGDEQGGKKPE